MVTVRGAVILLPKKAILPMPLGDPCSQFVPVLQLPSASTFHCEGAVPPITSETNPGLEKGSNAYVRPGNRLSTCELESLAVVHEESIPAPPIAPLYWITLNVPTSANETMSFSGNRLKAPPLIVRPPEVVTIIRSLLGLGVVVNS